ncbi:MAG: HD-GYP domain-containing protein [Desulfovibrio sp.]
MDEMSQPDSYFGISPLLIIPETLGSFAVYLKQRGRYVLYSGKEESFTDKHRQKLHDFGISEVYVDASDKESFDTYIESNIGEVIGNEKLPLEERSKVYYDTSQNIMSNLYDKIFEGKAPAKNFQRVNHLVKESLSFLQNEESLKALGKFISHDYKTYSHSMHVFYYTTAILSALGVDNKTIFYTGVGAMLHDIGKSTIPQGIITKPDKLNDRERSIMDTHSLQGVGIVTNMALHQISLNCILFHHEKIDGSGYPSGIFGEAIPKYVRVLTICDIYDALVSERPYAKAKTPFEALTTMKKFMNKKIDLDIFKTLINVLSGAELIG